MTNNSKVKEHVISYVDKESIGEELGIVKGDALLTVNDNQILDFIDYTFYEACEQVSLLIKKADGELVEYSFAKDENEPFGLRFENEFMDRQKSCRNKCVFCFIDQMPKKLRKTLYFKDDDWRLSLMMGNYVTLTNVDDSELQRIIERRVSPLYISVHATDPDVRAAMLGRGNCDILPSLKRLGENGITFHCQIVLCPGLNDGGVLQRTLEELYSLGQSCASVAVVPVGMTRFRKGLYELKKVDETVSKTTLSIINEFREKSLRERGTRFVFASDEIYITANEKLPSFEEYEDFGQIEDGIGMYAMFEHEFIHALKDVQSNDTNAGVICGVLIAPLMQELLNKLPCSGVAAIPVVNEFFGKSITVTGLLTGQDIIDHAKGNRLPKRLFISKDCLRHGESVFLDDVTLEQVREQLPEHEIIVCCGGDDLVKKLRK